jgi:hypothetical protein
LCHETGDGQWLSPFLLLGEQNPLLKSFYIRREERAMKLQFMIGILILILATCSAQPKVAGSGADGQVLIGPVCPVMQAAHPCPDQPYQATLTVKSADGVKIARVQSDANGQFKISLAPGTYILHPESPNGMPYAAEQTFSVIAGAFTQLNVRYDSGIR